MDNFNLNIGWRIALFPCIIFVQLIFNSSPKMAGFVSFFIDSNNVPMMSVSEESFVIWIIWVMKVPGASIIISVLLVVRVGEVFVFI